MKGIIEKAKAIEAEIIENRRVLHRHPEVGFDLPRTSAFVKEKLSEMGVEYRDCGGPLDEKVRKKFVDAGFPDMEKVTGVVATIGKGKPCILLRGDMDALPMEELNDLPFRSEVPNAAHMCGHDTHTAMLLGAAKILKGMEGELKGTVKLMFQPGEELGCGSKLMVDDGLMENPKVDAAVGIHIMSNYEKGTVSYVKGVMSASMDTYMINIQGKGGHSSMPHLSIDPLMIMSQLYTALNLLVTREVDPRDTVALTVGKAGGGSVANIIPDSAEIQVGMRTYCVGAREHLTGRIPEMIDHYIKAWRGDYKMETFATPSAFNDSDFCEEILPFVKEIVGGKMVLEDRAISGSEDFGYVSDLVPSAFLILGGGGAEYFPHHNPHMQVEESVFYLGSAIYANAAVEWLKKHSKQ